MNLNDFAHSILFGTRLEDKLIQVELADTPVTDRKPKPIDIPRFPGRPPRLNRLTKLCRKEKAAFPSIHHLHRPSERGKVLHFFANHELLAMELMALMLLRFPEAPSSFRLGIGKIIQEEQNHMRLYISRMRELGVEMGDIPVSDYFWNCLKDMHSPLDFTVQMSLTFEQANLDYSLFFMNAVERVGDSATAQILEQVFREEIGHVKHGLIWFNRWREAQATETDWDSYIRLLPPPLTPQRAKGFEFCESARERAGFSPTFIQNIKVFSASKGRPPTVWLYNPYCESEIARGCLGFSPKLSSQLISSDLEHLPMFLAHEQDQVLVKRLPSAEWLNSLQKLGFQIPEFLETNHPALPSTIAPKIGGFEPWGWSPTVCDRFAPLAQRMILTSGGNSQWSQNLLKKGSFELGKLFSKSWGAQILHQWLTHHPESHPYFGDTSIVGVICSTWTAAIEEVRRLLQLGYAVMIKAPYGTSGMQVKEIHDENDLTHRVREWMKNILLLQKEIVVERYLDPLVDLSIQMEIQSNQNIKIFAARQMVTGNHHEYRGAYLGKKLPGLDPAAQRFFHTALEHWQKLIQHVGEELRRNGYEGPAGIDALLWKEKDGSLRLKPLIEINPRWTMGRVGWEIEKFLAPGVTALWLFVSVAEVRKRGFSSLAEYARWIHEKYPLQTRPSHNRALITSGALFTSDPKQTENVATLLITLPNVELSP